MFLGHLDFGGLLVFHNRALEQLGVLVRFGHEFRLQLKLFQSHVCILNQAYVFEARLKSGNLLFS